MKSQQLHAQAGKSCCLASRVSRRVVVGASNRPQGVNEVHDAPLLSRKDLAEPVLAVWLVALCPHTGDATSCIGIIGVVICRCSRVLAEHVTESRRPGLRSLPAGV